MKTTSKSLGYIAIALALTLVIGVTAVFAQANGKASAEQATVLENATVVTSPFTDAVAKVKDSVVGVNNYGTVSNNGYYGYYFGFGDGWGNGNGNNDDSQSSRQVLQSGGSGVVIAQGYVLTNYHVAKDATALEVVSGDKTYPAVLAGHDEDLDIAVLKCDTLDIAPVTLGDSDKLSVGDWAICIGNPLSFTGTTTVGVISALNREITKSSGTDMYGRRSSVTNEMIQTDAAINSGNSGGGMFNVAGELIGVPSMKYTGSYYSSSAVEGIGMAIPINVAKQLISDVVSGNVSEDNGASAVQPEPTVNGDAATAAKPRIGVTVTNVSNFSSYAVSQNILPTGALVTAVEAGGPAEQAGLQKGDIVVEIDGTIIQSTTEMISLLQAKQAGDTASVKVYRSEGLLDAQTVSDIKDGEYVDLTVTLAILDNIKQ